MMCKFIEKIAFLCLYCFILDFVIELQNDFVWQMISRKSQYRTRYFMTFLRLFTSCPRTPKPSKILSLRTFRFDSETSFEYDDSIAMDFEM